MSRFRFSNRASALTIASLSATDLAVTLETGAGVTMPVLGPGDRFRAALVATGGIVELVDGIAVTGDVVTIERGKEGTAAQTFASGSRFEVRMTAGIADGFLQRAGDTMSGPLDMGNNRIDNAKFEGPQVFNTIHVNIIRSAAIPKDQPFSGPAENSINIPPNTNPTLEQRRPRYLGRAICNAQMFDGIVFDWFGDVNNVPSHLKLCNGSNGTPDLRNVFIRGWSDTFGVGAVGGAATKTTEPAGDHSHGGKVAGHALTGLELPAIGLTETRRTVESGGDYEMVEHISSIGYSATPGAPHQHDIALQNGHIHTFNSIPPFMAMAKVMFTV